MRRGKAAMRRRLRRAALAGAMLVAGAASAPAAPSVSVELIPQDGKVDVNDSVTLELKLAGATVAAGIKLPAVDGLRVDGSGFDAGAGWKGFTWFLTPTREGDFVIPAFDVRTDTGETVHVNAIRLHAPRPANDDSNDD